MADTSKVHRVYSKEFIRMTATVLFKGRSLREVSARGRVSSSGKGTLEGQSHTVARTAGVSPGHKQDTLTLDPDYRHLSNDVKA